MTLLFFLKPTHDEATILLYANALGGKKSKRKARKIVTKLVQARPLDEVETAEGLRLLNENWAKYLDDLAAEDDELLLLLQALL